MDNLKQIEILEEKLRIAQEEHDKRLESAPYTSYKEYYNYVSITSKVCCELSRQINLIREPNFTELSSFGDLMTIEEFVENVKSGGFIDYDGYGYYVKDNKQSDITIRPSDVENGIRKDFNKVIWFNR